MNYSEITIGIVTFRSEKVIFECLDSIKKIKNIIILDNSFDKLLKKKIISKYPYIKIFLSKKNLGYGVANNILIKKSKTQFVFILSPDVILEKNCEKNLLSSIKKLKKNFAILSPDDQKMTYGYFDRTKFPRKKLLKCDFVVGSALLINKNKMKKIGLFDENIFLYYEDRDLCKRIKFVNENVYVDKTSKINHFGAKSTNIGSEFEKCRNWHLMWSSVYFDRKYLFFLIFYAKNLFLLLSLTLRIIFYTVLLDKKKAMYKQYRLSGAYNSLIGKSSWYRPKI